MAMNNWDVSYSTITFVERALANHKKVEHFIREDDIRFIITRTDMSVLNVIIVDRYTLGLADVHAVLAEFGNVDCIVTSANWNYYTLEAKEYGLASSIGIFNIAEFFGALWWDNFKDYCKKDEDGKPQYAIR